MIFKPSLHAANASSNNRYASTRGTLALLDCRTALTAISCQRWAFFCFASLSSREIDLSDLNGTIAETPSSVAF